MRTMRRLHSLSMIGTALALAQAGWAISPADKCEADKNKIAGMYALCRQKAEAKAITMGGAPDYAKCDIKLSQHWMTAENDGGGMCPTIGDEAAFQTFVTMHANAVAAALSGVGLPRCGNNTIDVAGEQCDGTDMGGASCVTLGFGGALGCNGCVFDTSGCTCSGSSALPESGQTQCDAGGGTLGACPGSPAGQDGEVRAGAARSYTDNGDGTITDNVTGLLWEKLSDDGSVHDRDNSYTWYTAVTAKVTILNAGGGFAGHTDWRIPNALELESIVDLGRSSSPTISPAFDTSCAPGCTVTTCSCALDASYWSSTTSQANPTQGWLLSFVVGDLAPSPKTISLFARAVRGE